MSLNSYEMVYVLRPDVAESVNLGLVNYYRAFISKHGGQNVSIQHRGRRHLSYNILHYYDGIYVQINYDGNGRLVKLLEKSMRLNDSVMRYLTLNSAS